MMTIMSQVVNVPFFAPLKRSVMVQARFLLAKQDVGAAGGDSKAVVEGRSYEREC